VDANACGPSVQTGLAPAVPHFANLPFAFLHRTALVGAFGHLAKRPLASLHGAAINGALISNDSEASANIIVRIWRVSLPLMGEINAMPAAVSVNLQTLHQFPRSFLLVMRCLPTRFGGCHDGRQHAEA